MERLFEKVVIIFICVCLLAIAWSLWKPILISTGNLNRMGKAINSQADMQTVIAKEIKSMKKDIEIIQKDIKLIQKSKGGQE